MLYEIINPSDAYTLEAEDEAIACAATILLGRGAYGLTNEKGESVLPLFMFGGDPDAWMLKTHGQSLDAVFARKAEIAACLESVAIGQMKDRTTYLDALALIDDPAKKQQWRDQWHDKRRSSMNDIGGRAWALAESIRTKLPAEAA